MPAPRILICPLDWGLGHAARCVPIIHALRRAGAIPVMAADAAPLELLQKEFPDGEFLRFPGVTVSYPSSGANMFWSMLRQSPALLAGTRQEQRFVEKAVKEHNIQGLISDNRFGAYSRHLPSVYITHQIHIQTGNGFTDALARMQHARYMKNYHRVWIPDQKGEQNISGKLSHGKHIPKHATYIGLLSRFSAMPAGETKYDVAIILSGPEPQRSLLEDKFLRQLEAFPEKKFMLVRGKNDPLETTFPQLSVLPLATHADIQQVYASAVRVVCRSGYSSVMEMVSAGRSAWLVPTPGQTEQEYLARYLNGKYAFKQVRQEHFSLADVLASQEGIPKKITTDPKLLRAAVNDFLESL